MRVLLIEDDNMIGSAVRDALREASYAADWVTDGETGLTAALSQSYSLILLDLGLPGKDGQEVLRILRTRGDTTPVLIVTARDALEDRLNGLDAGADDYVIKPFQMAEVLARMRAIIRRHSKTVGSTLGTDEVALDLSTKEATVVGHLPVTLSSREFSLLQALLIRPGAILSRSELEDRIYGWGEEVESNAVEYIIHQLRKKLGRDVIRNVRGLGWMVARDA